MSARAPATRSPRWARSPRWTRSLLALLLLLGTPRADSAPPPPGLETLALPSDTLVLPPASPRLAAPIHLAARLSVSSHTRPTGAPDLVVHAPAGVDLHDTSLIVYLHGWEGCAQVLAASGATPCRAGEAPQPGWGLADRHDEAGTNSIMVVPQLMWRAQSGNPGRFREPGFASAWLEALVDEVLVPELGLRGREAIGEIVLVAHSGGYLTGLSLLKNDELPISSLVLLDALYGGADQVAAWALADPQRRAISLFTAHPGTRGQSLRLAQLAEAGIVGSVAVQPADLREAMQGHRVVVSQTADPHGLVPERSLSTVLAGLGLPTRSG